MTETYKILFNYKRLDEKDPQQFFVTYHIGHTREFLEFISECVLEADDCSKYADNVNEFKPDYIGKKIQDEVGDLIDGEVQVGSVPDSSIAFTSLGSRSLDGRSEMVEPPEVLASRP